MRLGLGGGGDKFAAPASSRAAQHAGAGPLLPAPVLLGMLVLGQGSTALQGALPAAHRPGFTATRPHPAHPTGKRGALRITPKPRSTLTRALAPLCPPGAAVPLRSSCV